MFYSVQNDSICIQRGLNAGFFASCQIRLMSIVHYFNTYKCIPSSVDSSQQFILYKKTIEDDITKDFFKSIDIPIDYTSHIRLCKQDDCLDQITYDSILPFITKYFTPSDHLIELMHQLIHTYNITPENCIGVYYRGRRLIRDYFSNF